MENNDNNVLEFKDEGGFYTTKLTADGKPCEKHKLYEFGTLSEHVCYTKKECREFAKSKGFKATFDF